MIRIQDEWYDKYLGTMSIKQYAQKTGVKLPTLKEFCRTDRSKSKDARKLKPRSLVTESQMRAFSMRINENGMGNNRSHCIAEMRREFPVLTEAQAVNQYYRYVRVLPQPLPPSQPQSLVPLRGSMVSDIEIAAPPPRFCSSLSSSDQYLNYQQVNKHMYQNGHIGLNNAKKGYPLRQYQAPELKLKYQGVTDAPEFLESIINVAISQRTDLLQLLQDLQLTPHCTEFLWRKEMNDRVLRAHNVRVIDVPEHILQFRDPIMTLFRGGTPEMNGISMTDYEKKDAIGVSSVTLYFRHLGA